MPNRHRLHVPGGTYYVFRSTDSRHPIFSRPEEYARFDELIPIALASSEAKLLAFCWLPKSVHLVIQIGERPVADFMRDLMWRYSRSAWQRTGEDRPWFRERYRATLVQAELYLKVLIRHVHYLPVRNGLATTPECYPYSSHFAYLGRRGGPPVRASKLLRLLGCQDNDLGPYLEAMAEPSDDAFTDLLERGMPETPGVIGDAQFISQHSMTEAVRTAQPTARLIEKLIAKVAE